MLMWHCTCDPHASDSSALCWHHVKKKKTKTVKRKEVKTKITSKIEI